MWCRPVWLTFVASVSPSRCSSRTSFASTFLRALPFPQGLLSSLLSVSKLEPQVTRSCCTELFKKVKVSTCQRDLLVVDDDCHCLFRTLALSPARVLSFSLLLTRLRSFSRSLACSFSLAVSPSLFLSFSLALFLPLSDPEKTQPGNRKPNNTTQRHKPVTAITIIQILVG